MRSGFSSALALLLYGPQVKWLSHLLRWICNDSESRIEIGYLDSLTDLLTDCRSNDSTKRQYCLGANVLGAMAAFAVPVMLVLGLLGNTLTTYVMLSERRLRQCRQNCYLAFIALSDSGNLLVWGLGWQFLAKGLPWVSNGTVGYFIVNASDFACRLFRFVHNLLHVLSANWFLLMTLDRVLTLHYPFRFRSRTEKFASRALAVSFIVSVVLVLPVPVFTGWYVLDNRIACLAVPFYGQAVRVWMIVWNALWMIPPMLQLLTTTLLNLLLLRKVLQIMRSRQDLVSIPRAASTIPATKPASTADEISPSVIVMLLSLMYFLSGMPPCIAQYIVLQQTVFSTNSEPSSLRTALNLGDIGQILLLFNQSINWLVLLWKSKVFRQGFLAALTCGSRIWKQHRELPIQPRQSIATSYARSQASNASASEAINQ